MEINGASEIPDDGLARAASCPSEHAAAALNAAAAALNAAAVGLWAAAAEPLVVVAQAQLERLAGNRGQMGELGPPISRLGSLLGRVLAIPPPLPKKKVNQEEAQGAEALGLPGKRCQRPMRRVQRPPPSRKSYRPPPPRPYGPLRWPPLEITLGVLKGRLAPVPPAAPRVQPADELRMPYFDEDVLDIAERFEAKLGRGRGRSSRRRGGGGGGGGEGGGGPSSDCRSEPKCSDPLALQQGRCTTGAEAARHLRKPAKLQEGKGRKAAARGDSYRCFPASKNAACVADLWPYK